MTTQIPTQSSHVSIYGLVDPRNQEVRYIGCTKNPITKRYKAHLRDPSRCLYKWMTELQAHNLYPTLSVFEVTTRKYQWKREAAYLQEYKSTALNIHKKVGRRYPE